MDLRGRIKISKDCISCLKQINPSLKLNNYCSNCNNKEMKTMKNIKKSVKEILETSG